QELNDQLATVKIPGWWHDLMSLTHVGGSICASKFNRVVWRSSWQLGKAGDPHTKPFFFPVVSAETCTDSHLEVDQSVDTTWTSVDTLSQISPEGVLGRSLVSTLPDQFCPKGVLEGL
ncbi:hypothetical protein Taro_055805, partial [Colocasia esculenta]|nr:hypothetical protein [Colocasia esculenta]